MATAHEFPARFADDPHSAEGLPVPAAEANTPAAVPGAALSSGLRSGRPQMAQARVVGSIAEAPEGNVFFKLTGPAKTVKAALAQFDKMLGSIKK